MEIQRVTVLGRGCLSILEALRPYAGGERWRPCPLVDVTAECGCARGAGSREARPAHAQADR